MKFTKEVITFTSYSNEEGWVIDVSEDNKVGIYNPKHKLVVFSELTFKEQKEVIPLLKFIEDDTNTTLNC